MKELDVVSLKSELKKLRAGARGTIVHENVRGREFIVEFFDEQGRTIALEDISHSELNLIIPYEGD
ncbi:MAG: DUF4926 domain-containing protein [Pseudomonadota bacterium]